MFADAAKSDDLLDELDDMEAECESEDLGCDMVSFAPKAMMACAAPQS